MKDFYTIGETAKLFGITTQTLRHYDKIGLLSPAYVDPETNYRYYCYQQFHLIDRIKYLQHFGLSLKDISVILHNGQNTCLLDYLQDTLDGLSREMEAVKKKQDDLNWYIQYHNYIDSLDSRAQLYHQRLPERYIVSVPCRYKEPLADMEIRLAGVKARPEYRNERFHRQYGYILDVDAFFRQEMYPKRYFTFLSSKPNLEDAEYRILPAGEYICTRTQLLHEAWNTELLQTYFGDTRPSMVLAMEFEDNLKDWSDAWYEIQMLYPTSITGK